MSAPPPRGAPEPLAADRLGVDASAGRRFNAEQGRRIKELVAELEREAGVVEARVSDVFAAVRLASPGAVVVFEPAARGVSSLFTEGGVAVRYHGEKGGTLSRCLQAAHRHLRLLPPVPECDGVRTVPAPAPSADAAKVGSTRPEREPDFRAPTTGMRAPMPLMAVNGALSALPHDAAARRLVELLWMPCPSIRFGCACNLSCTYCSVGADGPALLTQDSLRGEIDGLRALGYRGIGYMGGEPTVHPDFHSVARYAAARGFERQVLVTNGIRLADVDFAARAFAAGVNVVIESVDAFDAKVQERLYGRRGGYREAVAGLNNALAAPGVEVALSAVVTKLNAALLPGYMEEVARLQRRHNKKIGVLLHALQRPAKEGKDQKALALGMLEASGFVGKALSRARDLGVTALTLSFPPCLLPGHEQEVTELYANEWMVDLADGAAKRSTMRGAARYWMACTSCRHVGHCPGVLRQYADASVRAFVSSRAAASGSMENAAKTRKPRGVFLISSELGCPINLSLTTQLHNYVLANHWTLEDAESADCIIIVSCSSLPKSRRGVTAAVKHFAQLYPGKKIIVMGCIVKEDMAGAPPGASYIPLTRKEELDALLDPDVPLRDVSSGATLEGDLEVRALGDDKAVLNRPYNVMVATGCRNSCAFCVERLVFPAVRSVPLAEIISECKEGIRKGYTNFTIGATDVSSYGHDVGLDMTNLFSALFSEVFNGKPGLIVGFKGLEPSGVIKHFAGLKEYFRSGQITWICLPVESGSDGVLRGMNRKYRVADVLRLVKELRALAPALRIETEFVVCFPTETREDFEASLEVSKHFDHVNFLMYGRHENTRSFAMKDVFSEEERERRRKIIDEIKKHKVERSRPECCDRSEIRLPSSSGASGFSILSERPADGPAS